MCHEKSGRALIILKILFNYVSALLVLIFLMFASGNSQLSAKLIQSSDLSYLGSFKVPQGGGTANGAFEYGGSAMAYNPVNDSIYLVGHVYDQRTAELKIPALGGIATTIQPLTDSLEGKLGSVGIGSIYIGGHMIFNARLFTTAFVYYDGDGSQTLSHFSRPLSLATKGQVSGPSRAGSMGAGYYSGYMAPVPVEWQAALGGQAVTGNCCLSIISRTSYGPALFSFNPSSLGTATPLVYYTQSQQTLGIYGASGSHPVFNGTTRVKGVIIPAGTASVLFFGRTGIGNYCYGEASACGDPSSSSKGEHAYPYKLYVWAYDLRDLAQVRSGVRQPWSVVPYATWELAGSGDSEYSGAAAYDQATNRIFIAEQYGDGERPLIRVFKLSLASVPVPPLQAPTNLRVVP